MPSRASNDSHDYHFEETPVKGRPDGSRDRKRVRRAILPAPRVGGILSIFGKSEPQSDPPREGPSNDGPRGPTVIGPQARVVGEISGDEDVLIEGRLEGKIRTDRKVTIGGTGDVLGDVLARSVVVAGKVEGQIRAQERAELLPSASVTGSVQAPKVIIAEGAQLQGSVAMSAKDEAAESIETLS
jgi:cytoskeletal protein CcmA (bactofilin family)